MFQHFIITRFNLSVSEWKTTKNGDATLTDKWHEQRFHIFKTYCLPSIKNQTNKNFSWEIFFDTNTSLKYRNEISAIDWGDLSVGIYFINGSEALPHSLIEVLKKKIRPENQFVITTRLDNDDIIHQDFINCIQKMFTPKPNTVVDLRCGFQVSLLDQDMPPEIRDYNNNYNPFISLIEQKTDIKTIYSRMHEEWKENADIIAYLDKRLWIEFVHQSNKVNDVKKYLQDSLYFSAREFGIGHTQLKLEVNLKLLVKRFKRKFKQIFKKLIWPKKDRNNHNL